LGFGLVTSWAGRGVVGEDHPCSLGAMNGSGLQSIEDFYASVDLMLIVGSRVRGHETADFTVRLPARRIQVDIDPAANNRTYESEFFVCGDARATLDGLARRLRGKLHLDKAFAGQLQALKRQAREEYRRSLGPYASFADRLRSVLPRDAIWARDITIAHSTWGTRLFEVYGPRDSVYPMSAGIGEGLSLGIGAALAAAPRKTVILTGDGGLAFNLGELWTAVQEKAPAVIIVMNDGGYGVIRHIQDATAEGRRRYCDLLGPNLQDLAGLAGLSFWRVKEQETLVQSVAAALDTQGPAMVEVDMRAIGEAPRYYPYGPKIPNSAR
jgi:acetolactate synthase-1/2/3 large subunit